MQEIMQLDKPPNYEKFKYSNGWVSSFVDRYDVSSQVQTEKKPVSNALKDPILQNFHRETCEIQQGEGLNPRDPVYGRFSPKCIWNIDQIPASIIDAKRHSLNPKGQACWIANQGAAGLYKRSCTIIMTLRAEGEQIVPPFLLFHGKGKLSPEIIAELDEQGIPYAFNKKAWADGATYLHTALEVCCKNSEREVSRSKRAYALLGWTLCPGYNSIHRFGTRSEHSACVFPPELYAFGPTGRSSCGCMVQGMLAPLVST
jgi:hypothetical protein